MATALLAVLLHVGLSSPCAAECGGRLPGDQWECKLEDLETLALRNSPTLRQAEAALAVLKGKESQAGLYTNPSVGYQAEDISLRAPSKETRQSVFLEQRLVMGGKLRQDQDVASLRTRQAVTAGDAQRKRVLNSVGIAYWGVLLADRRVQLRGDLAGLARDEVLTSRELFNIGQADRPDVLAVEIEASRAQLALATAKRSAGRARARLSVLAGELELEKARFVGDITEDGLLRFVKEDRIRQFVEESPHMKNARLRADQARASLSRALSERIPDPTVRLGIGYNPGKFDTGTRIGPEALVELKIPLPVFDRNQGNIASARAAISSAEEEVRRLQSVLHLRISEALLDYENVLETVQQYGKEILPRAEEAYDLFAKRYMEMAATYPHVLRTRRAYLEAQITYAEALVEARQKMIAIEGLLLLDGLSIEVTHE